MSARITRRRFVQRAAGVGLSAAGLALLAGCGSRGGAPQTAAADAPPEVTGLRIADTGVFCHSPLFLAEDLLKVEGFSEVQYILNPAARPDSVASAGAADLGIGYAPALVARMDAGEPLVVLAGIHAGCLELFGADHVRTTRDLKGKTVSGGPPGSPPQTFLATMFVHVGLDPKRDVTWIDAAPHESPALLIEGAIDAVLASPPGPQMLRARGVGHVILNTATDRPWSQYFCCMLAANREFVQKHPVAARRALRAILKATDVCASEPERAAQLVLAKGLWRGSEPTKEYAAQGMRETPYDRWREYDPDDTLRFFALRLYDAGLIRNPPDKVLAQGTDWRFLNELKQELKA